MNVKEFVNISFHSKKVAGYSISFEHLKDTTKDWLVIKQID